MMLMLLDSASAEPMGGSAWGHKKRTASTEMMFVMRRCSREHVKEAIALKEASDCQPIAKVPNPKAIVIAMVLIWIPIGTKGTHFNVTTISICQCID